MNSEASAADGQPTVQQNLWRTLQAQRVSFEKHTPLSLAERLDALDTLLIGMVRYQEDFVQSLIADYGNRAPQETRLLEIFPVVDEIRHTKRHLKSWMRPKRVSVNWQFYPSKARIIYQPLGVVGIIGAWNYQVLLTLSPLVNVIAAGNHAMLKPSEMAPQTAEVIARMIEEIFPPTYVTVVNGGPEVSAAFSSLPFDHLIFTGSGRVGKLVMRAASENLTPVTLELGGKSPALVHPEYSLEVAADRICSGKFWNAGQTCVAPDYALVQEGKHDEFVAHAQAALARRFPRIVENADYTRIINARSYERMQSLVEDAKDKGARVLQVNPAGEDCNIDNRVFPPTLVTGVNDQMQIMREEIFGPILPFVKYRDLEDAITYINARPRPLALYYFDNNAKRVNHILTRTTSGGVTVNDTIFHQPQNDLPFGGVGPSGMGAYHGFVGFATFSKNKGVFLQSWLVGWFVSLLLKPPYSTLSDWFISLLIGRRARAIRKFVHLK